jgi:hypothetical protein
MARNQHTDNSWRLAGAADCGLVLMDYLLPINCADNVFEGSRSPQLDEKINAACQYARAIFGGNRNGRTV